MREHDFSPAVRKEIAQKAMYICANPNCLCLTGYTTREGKPRSIAEGAHILPSAKKGPRSGNIAKHQNIGLESAGNGIWLCTVCHKKVDDDPDHYTVELLISWKKDHEELIRRLVGKDLEAALLELRDTKRYHQETREFVSFLEDRRVLYEGLDMEFPPRVLDSLNLIRERLTQTRSRINPDTPLFSALTSLQKAISEFLQSIGKDTDLTTLRCDSNDPKWRNFAEELQKLRSKIIVIVKVISGDADYTLCWL